MLQLYVFMCRTIFSQALFILHISTIFYKSNTGDSDVKQTWETLLLKNSKLLKVAMKWRMRHTLSCCTSNWPCLMLAWNHKCVRSQKKSHCVFMLHFFSFSSSSDKSRRSAPIMAYLFESNMCPSANTRR